MEFGSGDHWVGVLVGGLFGLLLTLVFFGMLWSYLRRLWAALRGAPLRADDRPGAIGLLRDTGLFALRACLVVPFAVGSLWIAVSGLAYYVPAVGTSHPMITSALRLMAKPERTRRALERGLNSGDAALVELALAVGADPDAGERPGVLRSTDPVLRQLLLDYGARPDGYARQTAPLRTAVEDDDLDLWRWLLAHGARRGLTATREQPQPLLHALAVRDADLAWLEAVIEAGIDPNQADVGGASLLDALVLAQSSAAWIAPLLARGAQHRLPLAGAGLALDHPAAAVALAWLAQPRDARIWSSPLAADGAAVSDGLYLNEPGVIAVQGDQSQVLVRIRETGADLEAPQTVVLRLLPRSAEAAGAADAEAPGADAPAAGAEGVYWLVAGLWLDQRPE